jgi:hypothetical protein
MINGVDMHANVSLDFWTFNRDVFFMQRDDDLDRI